MSKVYVGCKLPNGIWMEIIKPHAAAVSLVPAAPTGPRIQLAGANSVRVERTNPADHGFGVTLVDEEFAKAWFENQKDSPFVKDGHVFMVASEAAVRSEIKDRKDEKTGLEPLRTDGKEPRLQGVKTDPNAGAIGNRSAA